MSFMLFSGRENNLPVKNEDTKLLEKGLVLPQFIATPAFQLTGDSVWK